MSVIKYSSMKLKFLCLLVIISLLSPAAPVLAQSEPVLPVYVIESGDTLYTVAYRFGIDLTDLIAANDFEDPNNLKIGDQVRIPGYEGLNGTISSIMIQPGENFRYLTVSTDADFASLSRLSRLTSPSELYIGTEVFTIKPANTVTKTSLGILLEKQSILESAILVGVNPWSILLGSSMNGESLLASGDPLFVTDSQDNPPEVSAPFLTVAPLPIVQGRSFALTLHNLSDPEIEAQFNGMPLVFHPDDNNSFTALAGIHAMQDPGLVPLSISARVDGKAVYGLDQNVIVQSGNYIAENVTGVDSYTIEPETIIEEDAILAELVQNTGTKYWTSSFSYPVDEPYLGSTFGRRRTYNGGAYNYYHTGVDFTVATADNLNIYAAAPGKVIYSDTLPIKGIFTIIDHGWGIYSGYAHQFESFVSPGQAVQAGDLIGTIGNTGRSVGPHLHWEVWVNGIPVDPLQWIQENIPS